MNNAIERKFEPTARHIEASLLEVCMLLGDRGVLYGPKVGKYVLATVPTNTQPREWIKATAWNFRWPTECTCAPFDTKETVAFDTHDDTMRFLNSIDIDEKLEVFQVRKRNGTYFAENYITKELVDV